MFELFEIKNRKTNREKFISKLENATQVLHNDPYIRGYIVCFIHIILVSIPFYFVITSNSLKIIIISQIALILILLQHFYFDGCWMIRLERRLWNTNKWYGLWTYLFNTIEYFGIVDELNRNMRDNIFFIVYSIILSFGFYRIYNKISI